MESRNFDTEISSWAYVTHVGDDKPPGGIYTAYDREDDAQVGWLSYFWLDDEHTQIQFKDVLVDQAYRRRKVATALLRTLYLDHPESRINPGARNFAGGVFMDHILATEPDLVASNGVLQVPLKTMLPSQFRLAPVGWSDAP